ncbi:hypothetical protein SAMN05518849_11649 [Sphingobium sp. AP50]|uniref:hypothetical protein n=1 Tax=Sphingobium sp. AP50 TaxID=1884369 RepID=UPI0008B67383|nr:hypothetical protein [Sphingobium sp. AP50]SEJ87024.1 hypothetical protein SAMN05518849_11649 [Sphingobium sp. AP50]
MWDKVTIDHYALRSYAVSPVPVEDGLVVVAVDLDGNANQWIEYRAGRMMSAHALAFTITGSGLSLYYSNLLNCYGAQDMDVFSILSVVCFPAAELDWRDRVPHAEIISVIDSYLAATAN